MSTEPARPLLKTQRNPLAREALDTALDTDDTRASTLWSMGLWAGFAALFLSLAIIATRSDSAQERIASLFDGRAFRSQGEAERVAAVTMQNYETQRLAAAIRVLGTEREQLATRLDTLERSMGDVTASITPNTTPRNPAASARPGTLETIAPPTVVAAAAVPANGAADSTVIRTEFGVDLAGESTIEGLRARWSQLRAQQSAQLDGLRPLVNIRDSQKPGAVELRLIAGPLSNANAAARLCVTLGNAGLDCKPTVFEGQRLTLR